MLSLTTDYLQQLLGSFWWPFSRLLGAFLVMPFLGHIHVPVLIRVLLALLLAALIIPILPAVPVLDALSFRAVLLALEQLLLGMMLGLFLSIMLHILSLLSTILSMQMGLSMALANDPGSSSSQPLLGQMLVMYGTLLFLALDGHLVAIGIIVDSFRLWPIGNGLFDLPLMQLIGQFGWMFAAALMLALPAVMAMLVVNLTFGVLSRSAPSLNIFALGFPMTMIMGLVCVLLSFSTLPDRYSDFCLDALFAMHQFLGGSQ
ncbi:MULTISPECIES: flagellar biosynthetic protein FliR [Shewanella]|jgi:flagellar biosynthetic protein FliR|uniref:Flagellar biosynthetic protein FliR n=1 Tax=bacterium 19NY03SH02 TaxID=2920631 RepID=A0AAU6V4A8_UNCXX|nr:MULTISPECIES: flagellar biosynthetic protein FliR [Shewanella]AYV11683.1 flagellar biosynthetic protein FliR [Shewanella algae]MBC8794886.1 flagellar biosynthetic protein FliR [Shewanella algae]MBO2554563.1 flagellar biosynthetic protein FliR [Shewanella algae]MBO2567277.1 flagellar biosynthetic protein FliR [Shewanella algae]MBO2571488.1 flagellar biosynthetic protein FliR [Shewanella algae]